ncbi:MAG: hypothetical protein Q8743_02495 [Candidatus Phytoplasma australasiaticum]|nr:hypothetical protein [Candidatus Phytoplasma australasiaticum]
MGDETSGGAGEFFFYQGRQKIIVCGCQNKTKNIVLFGHEIQSSFIQMDIHYHYAKGITFIKDVQF